MATSDCVGAEMKSLPRTMFQGIPGVSGTPWKDVMLGVGVDEHRWE